MHFPHPVPPEAEWMYDGVAYAGDKNVDTEVPFGPRKFRWRLYSTMLFQALLQSFQKHPGRQWILLNQSCLSAGHARFLHHAPFVQHFGTQRWPVCLVSTAGPYETSIADFCKSRADVHVDRTQDGDERGARREARRFPPC